MQLIPKVEKQLWDLFDTSKYQNVRRYIKKWHVDWYDFNEDRENFHIYYKDEGSKEIDLTETLHNMPAETVLKIAIDLGIDTPNFLPAISKFKNVLKERNKNAYQDFERASKNVYDEPDLSVALASSALDGIIKTILNHEVFKADEKINNAALTKQVGLIVKKLGLTEKTAPQEIITLASNIRSLGSTIDDIRSSKTAAHGKLEEEYKVDDPLWASFVVNACATLGLFLWEYFEKKYKPFVKLETNDLSEIPF